MRRTRVLLIGVAMAVALAACGGEDGGQTNGDSEDPTLIRYVYCAETLASSGAPFWIGEALGYFEEENIELEMIPVSGGTGACLQTLAASQADISAPSPDVLLTAAADGTELDLVYFYEVAPEYLFDATVLPDSDVDDFSDLEGATVGVASLGGSFETFARVALESAGVDPDSATYVAVGTDAAAAETLVNGDIDVLVLNDVRYASLEAAGYEFRYLEKPGVTADLFGAGLLVRQDWLDENFDAAVGYARAYTKSAIFAIENPEAAIRLHWELYPQFKPDGDEAEAMAGQLPVLDRRLSVVENEGTADNPWGQFTESSWTAWVEFLGLSDSIDDVTPFYVNDVAEAIGDIDAEAIREEARNWSP